MGIHLPPVLAPHLPRADVTDREWTGTECLRTLLRRKNTLAWITLCGALAAGIFTLAQPRSYQSQVSIEILGVNENSFSFREPVAAPGADSIGVYLQTQVEILQQDDLIEEVVRKLRLAERPEYQGSGSFWSRLRPNKSAEVSPYVAIRNAVDIVKKDIRIVPVRNSRIIQIVSEARSPTLAAELANTIAHTFIEQKMDARQRVAQQTYDSLRLQLEALRAGILRSNSRIGEWALNYALGPEAEANRRFYSALLQRVNDAKIASTVRESNFRVASPARPADRPFKPNVPLNLALGTFGGLLLAIGSVMLREQTNSVLRAPGEAGTYLTVPELGAIPRAAAASRFAGTRNGRVHVERAAFEERYSDLSESFRTTVASILSSGRNGDHPRTLVVTSSRPDEGKTTVVSNLGIALAEISRKVLLIDGDMRHPRLHRVFDQANSWGFSDVLREKNAIDELPLDVLVKKTAVPHLYLLPSGAACTENIFALLHSGRMSRLLPRFREEFDYVLVDAPPCLEFADARIMARYAEQLLLVVRADYTDRATAQAAVDRLLLDGLPVMGVILNRWDPARTDRYSYRLNRFIRQGLS